MALEILDGTIDATAPLQGRDGFSIFDTIRYLDKLVDEPAKGKAMEKILRGQC